MFGWRRYDAVDVYPKRLYKPHHWESRLGQWVLLKRVCGQPLQGCVYSMGFLSTRLKPVYCEMICLRRRHVLNKRTTDLWIVQGRESMLCQLVSHAVETVEWEIVDLIRQKTWTLFITLCWQGYQSYFPC